MKNPRVHPAVRRLALGVLALALGVGARLAFGTPLPQGAANEGAVPRERESHESRHAARDARDDRSAAARSRHRDRNPTAQGPPLTRLQADALLERRADTRIRAEGLIVFTRRERWDVNLTLVTELMEWNENQHEQVLDLIVGFQSDLIQIYQSHLKVETLSPGRYVASSDSMADPISARKERLLDDLRAVTGHADLQRFLLLTNLENAILQLPDLRFRIYFGVLPALEGLPQNLFMDLSNVESEEYAFRIRIRMGSDANPLENMPAVFRGIDWSPHLAAAMRDAGIE